MIKNVVTIQDVVDLLNDALERDPNAINMLFHYSVPCNNQLAEHPTIPINCEVKDFPRATILGILNGIFGYCDFKKNGPIACIIDEKLYRHGIFKIIRFEYREGVEVKYNLQESITAQEMLLKINEYVDNVIKNYSSSMQPTKQEIYLMWCLTEIDRLNKQIYNQDEEVKGVSKRSNRCYIVKGEQKGDHFE